MKMHGRVLWVLSTFFILCHSLESSGSFNFLEFRAFLNNEVDALQKKHQPLAITSSIVFEENGEWKQLVHATGLTQTENGQPVGPESLFRVGSLTKVFTGVGILQLVEIGKINLESDVNNYLPATVRVPEHPSGPITIRHLMTHTAGFEDRLAYLFVSNSSSMLTLEQFMSRTMPSRVRPVDDVVMYSSHGFVLLGMAIEHASGVPYDRYISEHILRPLGMTDTTLDQFEMHTRPNAARSFEWDLFSDAHVAVPFTWTNAVPAGGVASTAVDMAKLMQSLLDGGSVSHGSDTRILSPLTISNLLFQTHFRNHPAMPGVTLSMSERIAPDGVRVIEQAGDIPAFSSGMYLIPDRRIGLFISHSSNSLSLREDFIMSFLEAFFPAPIETASSTSQENGGFIFSPETGIEPSSVVIDKFDQPPHPDQEGGAEGGDEFSEVQPFVPDLSAVSVPANSDVLRKFVGTYVLSRHSYTTFEKLAVFGMEFVVEIVEAPIFANKTTQIVPALVVDFPPVLAAHVPNEMVFLPTRHDPLLFQCISDDAHGHELLGGTGKHAMLAFRRSPETGEITNLFVHFSAPLSADRIGDWKTASSQVTMFMACIMCFLSVLAGWPMAYLKKSLMPRAGQPQVPDQNDIARGRAKMIGYACALGHVVFLVYNFSLGMRYGAQMLFEPPEELLTLAWLPRLESALTLIMVTMAASSFSNPRWGFFGRAHFLALTTSSAVFLWTLHNWNLFSIANGVVRREEL